MKRVLAVILAVIMVISMCACGEMVPQEKVTFRLGVIGGYDTLNPFTTEMAFVDDILTLCYDSLIAFDENYEAIPRAAESWEISADGLEWTFHLRNDIKYSDGTFMTSEDVKWTYENLIKSYIYNIHVNGWESIECPDDYTVVFTCAEPKANMLYQVVPILPKHVWETKNMMEDDNQDMIGSGPFLYSQEDSGNSIVMLRKNADYWGKQAAVDELAFVQYQTYEEIAMALQEGGLDGCFKLDKTMYDELADNPDIYIDFFGGFSFDYIGYNLLDSILSDINVRYAIDYCIDRKEIIEKAYDGMAEAAYGAVADFGYRYTPSPEMLRETSVEKAKALLEKSGYVDRDGDGIREKNGTPLSLTLYSGDERKNWQVGLVDSLSKNCREAGINIVWETMSLTDLWTTCVDGNPDWQMSLDGWVGEPDPGYILCIFQSYDQGGYASVSYSSSEFNTNYKAACTTIDEGARANYIKACQNIVYRDCPYSFIAFDQVVEAINCAHWTGYTSTNMGLFCCKRVDNYVDVRPVN